MAVVLLWWSRDPEATLAPPRHAPGVVVRTSHHEHETQPTKNEQAGKEDVEQPPLRFRNDSQHTGRSSFVGPTTANFLWSFETESRISAQPVVNHEGQIIIGAHDGKLYALSQYGRELWKRDLGGPIYSTPLIDDEGNIYVGSDAKHVTSFTSRGEMRWRLQTEHEADTGIVLSPNGLLHFGAGIELWAIQTDGTVVWRFESQGKIFSTPVVDQNGTVYVGSQDDHFYAISAEGEMRWSYRTGDDNDASPMIDDQGHLYFGSDDHFVYSLTREGELRWSADLQGMVRAPLGLGRRGEILVGVFGPRPRLVALDAEQGEVLWYFPVTVADSQGIGISSGALIDREGFIYFGAHDDYLYSLAPNGELRWVFEAAADIDTNPILTPDGTLLVGSDDHRLYAFR